MISFFVTGQPITQGSKKGFVNPRTGRVIITDDAGAPRKHWRTLVTDNALYAMGEQPPFPAPVYIDLTFFLPKPKSAPKGRVTWPTKKPDIDKLTRPVLDSLKGVCYQDDSNIIDLAVKKEWAVPDEGQLVGVLIEVGCLVPSMTQDAPLLGELA